MKTTKSFLLLTALVTVSFLLLTGCTQNDSSSQNVKEQTLLTVTDSYLSSITNRGKWWLGSFSKDDIPRVANLLELTRHKIEKTMFECKDISPYTKLIVNKFPKMYPTIYTQGVSVTVGENNVIPYLDSLEICFIPYNEFAADKFPSALFFNPKWGSIMIACENWPDILWSGLLMHELGHAYEFQIGNIHKVASDAWFNEEVTMHELEAQIFDFRTQGKYMEVIRREVIRRIIKRYPKDNVQDFVNSIKPADLFELDKIIGLENEGPHIRSISVAEHYLALGFTFLELKGKDSKEKIDYYKWLMVTIA